MKWRSLPSWIASLTISRLLTIGFLTVCLTCPRTCSAQNDDRSDYGHMLEGVDADVAVWWCDATRKVSPTRELPVSVSSVVRLSAARNDLEAVQIVVRPKTELRGLSATASELRNPQGATIASDRVQILRVAYHLVHTPTDSSGVPGRWPDALPPLNGRLKVPAGENQPLWVLYDIPADARPGEYSGQVTLRAEAWSAIVPIRLRIWDFVLPERNHIQTAFGLSVGTIFRYHQLTREVDKRAVLDLYFKSFAEHRISPYDPAPLDPIEVDFLHKEDPPRVRIDFGNFDKAMRRAVDEFHFTSFRLRIRGMGGGTFHSRQEPSIGSFGAETPQYQALMASYLSQLESHLRDKGWLNMAYVYWFDEPASKDYPFVVEGMKRLKRFAPGLQRMLTEEPREELAGEVDIWCPLSKNYDPEQAEQRRRHGERIWWYICTGPKAPYCTLFIDHPATELRVWLWQTWQRDVTGILVWSSNYWTSSAAFPDHPQNPYEDPMAYTSGYSTPRGVKRHWGNGDGRFIYPPLLAAVPGRSGSDPVIEPPVSSIRWEMLREGIEDYEMLYLLRQLLENRSDLSPQRRDEYARLLAVPPDITADMTSFTVDPTPIYAHREKVAQAIEQLTRTRD